MAQLNDVTRWNFGFELWLPDGARSHHLVWGNEAIVRGKLFALRSRIDKPGPFDELTDVEACIQLALRESAQELLDAEADPLLG